MANPRSRWEDAVWRDAVDFLQLQIWRAAARETVLEYGDRGGHRPETGRSTVEGEEALRQPLLYRAYC